MAAELRETRHCIRTCLGARARRVEFAEGMDDSDRQKLWASLSTAERTAVREGLKVAAGADALEHEPLWYMCSASSTWRLTVLERGATALLEFVGDNSCGKGIVAHSDGSTRPLYTVAGDGLTCCSPGLEPEVRAAERRRHNWARGDDTDEQCAKN